LFFEVRSRLLQKFAFRRIVGQHHSLFCVHAGYDAYLDDYFSGEANDNAAN